MFIVHFNCFPVFPLVVAFLLWGWEGGDARFRYDAQAALQLLVSSNPSTSAS